ncbi:MAG TPA: tyrosine-type recombinase/integrase [Terriglobales bacterium]|nr:tyrosine-type recombinase/integrase [Terriglobales bacterium]
MSFSSQVLSDASGLNVAMSVGATSDLWTKLKAVLPAETYKRFADYAGVQEQEKVHVPTWAELKDAFDVFTKQRIAIGKLSQSTADRYQHTTRQGTSLSLDTAILHRVFWYAVDSEMMAKNPVRMEGRPGENPTNGAEPFTADDLAKLRKHAADDLLAFALLRWTGLRASDAVGLKWSEVHFDRKEIERLTQKRKRKLCCRFSLNSWRCSKWSARRKPKPEDTVLLNPETGKKLDRPRLYKRLVTIGKSAGVSNARPRRFRDTLAVDMLSRGATPYDVARSTTHLS